MDDNVEVEEKDSNSEQQYSNTLNEKQDRNTIKALVFWLHFPLEVLTRLK